MEEKEKKQIVIDLDAETKEAVERRARENLRSTKAEIAHIVMSAIRKS